ncbi:MAG: penicillin acylase family protein [Candidatus Lokiarchaeota archaeon]|nr:penicillin acylase family protein [Candidatus Lokiarchaeota archaeon]
MGKIDKKNLTAFIIVSVVTVGVITAFSLPFGMIPALGNLLFPGGGIWNIPGEVPEYEELDVFNLNDDVTIIRDKWGVPHIYARNEADLAFALGYCHAQDRMFQMDMGRREVQGRLAEVLGELAPGVEEYDKFNLALGMKYWSEKTAEYALELQENGTIDYMDDWTKYADGVNYYLDTHKNQKPLEYYLLDFEPERWNIVDSFSYTAYMSSMLIMQFSDLTRYSDLMAYQSSGYEEWYFEKYNNVHPYQIPIVPEYGGYSSLPVPQSFKLDISTANIELANGFTNFLDSIDDLPYQTDLLTREYTHGSNNWVVNGSKTTTGKPILCNDMHLAWNSPGIWYEAHLVCENTGLNTYGFTIAGVPIPVVAHNNYVGWGFTNSGMDVQDFYYYEEVNDTHYIYNKTTIPYTFKNYDIKVKGQKEPIELVIKETVHGPVVSELSYMGFSAENFGLENVVLATQWTLYNITNTFRALYGFNHATNLVEFNEASKFFDVPGQNIVYADVYGNIQIRPTAHVPIRDDSNIPSWHTGNGTLPYNGSNGEGDWIGYIPFGDLPVSTNPIQKYLTSANQVSVGPDFTQYHLQSYGYADGYRARRINEVLSAALDGTIDIEFMKNLHLDIKSVPAAEFTPIILTELDNYYGSSKPLSISSIYTILDEWDDYRMDKDLVAPTIFRVWRNEIYDAIYGDESNQYNIDAYPDFNLVEYIMKENATSHWFDDVTTTSTIENRSDCIVKAMNQTITYLTNLFGSENPTTWRWGEIHKGAFPDLLGIGVGYIGPFELDGSGYTVTPSGIGLRSNSVRYATHGASERLIVDFSNLNNSISVIPSGQRAIQSSKHYSNQLIELFLQGKYHEQWFTNTASNFPTQAISSQIYFKGGT